ncbi:uncharacterized protein LOC100263637 [Vitis vinifera]|uniref:Uncharacterized protein n=2 Tax=Vitis vinifera TaxID=29760 RepID=A0A438IL97_VITVI|nr:uncharacterized protein LOC100263637 [Vitis vinifera]RVW97453.1 hypothetical protein CK203_026211 [Vitis vinifera]|eukprot:XP_002268249.1 PREDICTED: uncharacterized protein LOC100263637 [Vitis vinifera]
MNSKPFLLLCLLLAAVLLTSSAASAKISIDEKNVEAADQQVNQVAHASTQGGCGYGSGYVTNRRGRIAQSLGCKNGCCSWGPRKICRRCCSSAEEALNNKKN